MSTENDFQTRLVPAVCPHCGASIQADPTQEAAVCRYCNAPFVVEKAIQNSDVRNENTEDVDSVNKDTKGFADSFFSCLGTQMSERRAVWQEERREQRAESREMDRAFMKLFSYMMIGMFLLAAIAFIVMQIRGDPETVGSEPGIIESEEYSHSF